MIRRRAAILDADVVGYSRLMGFDEAGTFAALKAHRRELLFPEIAKHNGRVFKLVGDGTVAEFVAAADAVACAMAIQHVMATRNEAIDASRRMVFRIGVHFGDVTVEDEDLFGEGVDVAGRLQRIGPPGGICLSQQVHDELVAAGIEIDATDLGCSTFADVPNPVGIWAWSPTGDVVANPTPTPEPTLPSSRGRPSIAILPFINMSNDPEQEHFADGFTEELTATLARCRWLVVASRNSSFTYKGKPFDMRQIARELEVRYLIEGSIRRSGNRIRITAQLLAGADGDLLWAERYDRMLDDVFKVQDEIATQITGTVEPELGVIEFAALRGRTSSDLDAWDIYLKGLWHLYNFKLEDLKIAKQLLEQAIAMDPSFVQAHARLAYVHIQLGWYGPLEERAARLADAFKLSERAIALDDREPAAFLALGRAFALSGRPERGIEHLRHALSLDSSFAQAHFGLGQALCYIERQEEGIPEILEAFRLSPCDPHLWTFCNMLAIAHYQAGRMDEAAKAARTGLQQPNVTFWPAMVLVAVLGSQGKTAEARQAVKELQRFRPGLTSRSARKEFYFGQNSAMPEHFINRFVVDLLKGGLPE
ncbi:tetratricopeptide repeat protein [Rhizobium sp. BK251]|uniref:adenylate/guanylate cyclase domain-containing protein n=1 Tax=Rhizobium sp. BK251 TaxID=2512125 RepID=UPI0010E5370C|nr:tetratricopeptide repeat protein [Rhizobium sp. BK251]TCL74827.1 TolB-like protein [Rhizobium sp. BK251]